MKNFIKISLITFALFLSANASAQLLPLSLGIKGGVNVSDIKNAGAKSRAGYNAGLTLDLHMPANFAIMTGLEVTSKGHKVKDSNASRNATYLQLPIHAGYRLKLVPGITAHFDLGPYFAQGITGKTKAGDDKFNTFGSDAGQWKKFDWGIGVGVGVTFIGKVQVRAGYDQGIANVAQSGDRNRNRNAYLSAGWLIF